MYKNKIYKIILNISEEFNCDIKQSFSIVINYIGYKLGLTGAIHFSKKNIDEVLKQINFIELKKSPNILRDVYLMVYDYIPIESNYKHMLLNDNVEAYIFRNIGLSNKAFSIRKEKKDCIIFGFVSDITIYKLNLILNKLFNTDIFFILVDDCKKVNLIDYFSYVGRENLWY